MKAKGLATLRTWEKVTLETVSRGFVPSGGSFSPGALDVGVPKMIAAMGRDMDPLSWRIVRMLLNAIEVAPVFRGTGRRLSRLSPSEAEEYLSRAIGQGVVGPTATWLLRLLVEASFFSSPELQAELGIGHEGLYNDPPVPLPLPPVKTQAYPAVAPGTELEVDACIIGSGAGGAPAAAILSEGGWSVAVLEEGPAVSRPDFKGSPIMRIGRYYRSNGIFFTLGKPMVQISYASSVGGTTVFNSGTCLLPSAATLDKWSTSLHLPSVRESNMRPYFDRVLKFMQVGPSRADILGRNAEVLRRGAEAMGNSLPHRVIPRPAPGCRGNDECVIGCPTDSKRSMALSYLPRAIASGTKVYSRVRVGRVAPGPGGKARWIVSGQLLEPSTLAPMGSLTVRCRHVVISAGALHTPYLLPNAGTRAARAHRGRHLHIHPSFDVGGDFPEEIRGWRGVLQSYLVDDTPHGILLEATFHPRGFVSTSGLTPFTGHRYKDFLPRMPHLALIGVLVMDETEGRLLPYFAGRPWVSYNMLPADLAKVGKGIALSGKLFFAAGAERVFVPLHGGQVVTRPEELDRWEHEAPPPEALHLLAFHPLGSARMAGEADLGALDSSGTVWDAPGLHVSDASMLPGSPGVNPQISIIALAERNAEVWVKAGVNA